MKMTYVSRSPTSSSMPGAILKRPSRQRFNGMSKLALRDTFEVSMPRIRSRKYM